MTTADDHGETLWRPAWLLASGVIGVMAVLTALSFWIRSLDVGTRPEVLDGAALSLDWVGLGWRFDAVIFGSSVAVSALVLARDRSHPYGWVLLVATGVIPVLTMTVSSALLSSIAGELPRSWAPWLAAALPVMLIAVVVGFTTAMALFPTGRPHSPRWARAFRLFWALWAVVAVLATFAPGPSWAGMADRAWSFENPVGVAALGWFDPIIVEVGAVVFGLFVVSSVVARYRTSESEIRHQLKWVMTAGMIVIIVSVLPTDSVTFGYFQTAAGLLIVGAFAVSITRYRLYDIDLIINRSLVFVVLVGFITVVYAGVVVGVGSLVGGSSLGWSVAGTALVAVVFEPVRDRVQRWVNRLVLGRRATPYEVLSDLTSRLAATEREEGLLGRMALRLAEGTGADRAVVWIADGARLHAVACEPESDRPVGHVDGLGAIPGPVVPIDHEGERLGALSVESRRGDALTPTELRLVEDLAGSAGLLMRRLRLDAELAEKARELEESRRRLVDAQDVERRRLERELNEGPQQRVVGLKVRLGLAEQVAFEEGADTVVGLIAQMASETQDAIDQIRGLANGIYPPVLEAEGLRAAVTALAELAAVDVRVDVDVSDRYLLPVEGAVYFCVSEALTNAVKHGEPPVTITVSDRDGDLSFMVSDSGPGFDPETVHRGAGLSNMTDRLDALNGTITIESTPGGATTITGRLPLPVAVWV